MDVNKLVQEQMKNPNIAPGMAQQIGAQVQMNGGDTTQLVDQLAQLFNGPQTAGPPPMGKQGGGPTNPVPEDTIEGSLLENTYDDEEAAMALIEAMSQADPKTVAAALEAFAAGNQNGGIGASPADLLAILQQGGPVGDKMAAKEGGGVPADILQQLLGDEMMQ